MTSFHSPADEEHQLEPIREENDKPLPPIDFQEPITSTPLRPSPITPKQKKQYENVSNLPLPQPVVNPQQSGSMLNKQDLHRLQQKHKEALKKNNSGNGRRSRIRSLFRARTCKAVLFAVYCAFAVTLLASGATFLTVGLVLGIKSCLIVGTLLLFTSFGICANHCFTQNAGHAREQTLEEKLVAQEEHKIIHAVADRNVSFSTHPNKVGYLSVSQQSLNSQDKESSPVPAAVQEAVMASAVDNIISRRLSTSMGLYADPAAKMIMLQGSHRGHRRASMMHLARSMSMAHHDPWLMTSRCEDYSEFA